MKKIIGSLIACLLLFYPVLYFALTRPKLLSMYKSMNVVGLSTLTGDIVCVLLILAGLTLLYFTFRKRE